VADCVPEFPATSRTVQETSTRPSSFPVSLTVCERSGSDETPRDTPSTKHSTDANPASTTCTATSIADFTICPFTGLTRKFAGAELSALASSCAVPSLSAASRAVAAMVNGPSRSVAVSKLASQAATGGAEQVWMVSPFTAMAMPVTPLVASRAVARMAMTPRT